MSLDTSRKAVKLSRVVDENARECGLSRPLAEEIEQPRIVWLILSLGGMRPVAAPDQSLGRRLDVCNRNGAGIGIVGGAQLARHVGAGQLDPGLAAIEQPANDLVGRTCQTVRLWYLREMVEHESPGQRRKQVRVVLDLLRTHVDLAVPAEIGQPRGKQLERTDR